MEIMDVLKLECCENNFKAKNKDEALQIIAKNMSNSEVFENISEKDIYEGLKKREDTASTGFDNGIAIPHCQLEGIDDFVVGLFVAKKGIDFEAMDNKKSHLFAVIIGPKGDQTNHLQLLAKISNELKNKNIRKELLNSKTKLELYENFIRHSSLDDVKFEQKGQSKLMIIIVDKEELIQDITEIFLEYNITQATILESKKMENILSDIPLFMGFFDFTGKKSVYNQIILIKINENKINAVVKSIEDLVGDLDNYRGLSLFVLDLLNAKGKI